MAIDIVAGMRVFTAVVDAGSFAGAADRLDLSRGMATRYVAQLEAHLGVYSGPRFQDSGLSCPLS